MGLLCAVAAGEPGPDWPRSTQRCRQENVTLNQIVSTEGAFAGEPRLVPKLQPAVARRGRPPARANSFLVQRAVETTTRLPRHQAVTMWTRPPVKLGAGSAHRAPSYRPCGQGVDKCAALDHPFPTLGALASSSSPPRQQSVMRKATSPPASASRTVPSSQEIRLRNIPVKSRGDPTS